MKNHRIDRLPGYPATRLPGFPATRLPGYPATRLSGYPLPGYPVDPAASSQRVRRRVY